MVSVIICGYFSEIWIEHKDNKSTIVTYPSGPYVRKDMQVQVLLSAPYLDVTMEIILI